VIPAKVSLKNFLTFAADDDGNPIVLDFDGASLWSIAGVNGAGKSAIFDAITYALYGEHRGGRQQDNRLIRKGTTTAEVAFEFIRGGQRYRIQRSITRKTSRQGQPRPDAKHVQASIWSDTDQAWVAIPDTDKTAELEAWVRSMVGMGPESFCSAVLLRQGEADKFLNARANQRFQILAGLIDLRAYRHLEQLATGRRKSADIKVGLLDQQLASIDPVSDEQVAGAASRLTTAELSAKTADRERLKADRRYQDAQRNAELQERRSELLLRKTELDAVVNNAINIRSRAAEKNQVEETIKPVKAALAEFHQAAEAAAMADEAHTRFETIDLAALDLAATTAATVQQTLDEELDGLNDRATQLASLLNSANEVRRRRVEQDARAQTLAKAGDPVQLRQQAERLAGQLEVARAKIADLESDHGKALDLRGAAQGRLQQAEKRLDTLDDLRGEPTCSRCGQAITAEHLERERRDADSEHERATTRLAAHQATVEELEGALVSAKNTADDLDRQSRTADKATDTAEAARQELDNVIAQVQIAVTAVAESGRDAPEAQLVAVITDSPLDEAEQALASLSELDESARDAIRQTRKSRDKARNLAQSTKQALDDGRRDHAELERAASAHQERAQHLTDQADIRLADVPASIAVAVRARDDKILEQLQARLTELADAQDELAQLETAEADLTAVAASIEHIERDIALIDPDHQMPLHDAQTALQQAEQNLKQAQDLRDTARDEHNRLSEAQQARTQLTGQLTAERQRGRIARRLAVLLGKTELQGRLLTDATAGVEAYANDTLVRISGGTLEITLRREDGRDEASLDIFVHDRSSALEPLEVAFISGSQKFRVAVALAAGLGQYLGGGTTIHSLIIDEGFGSLDTDGRQRMIHELRTLAEHLDRIIVVSHQEDFADRTLFPAEYVLRKDGTRTTVARVG
jgi:exonuclease SbcC